MLLISGCIVETVPLPEAQPDEPETTNDAAGKIETSLLYYTESPAILIGVEDAVTPSARVVIRNLQRTGWQGEAGAKADGSFYMPISAAVGDTLEISLRQYGVELARDKLLLESASSLAKATVVELLDPNGTILGCAAAPPDAQGMVLVFGAAESVPEGIVIVVGNANSGAATAGYGTDDGSYEIWIAGQSGDEISVAIVEPGASNAGSEPISLIVPY